MTIKIEIQKTSDTGDMGTKDDYTVTVDDRGTVFDFDIEGPKDLLSLSYQEIFKKIAAADDDAWEAMALAGVDKRQFTFNNEVMTPEDVVAALDGHGITNQPKI